MGLVDAAGLVGAFALVYVARLIVIQRAAVREMPLPPEHYLSWVWMPQQVGAADSMPAVLVEAGAGAEEAAAGGEDGEKPPGGDPDQREIPEGEHGPREEVEAGTGREQGQAGVRRETWAFTDAERLTWGVLLGAGAHAILANLDNIEHLLSIDWNVIQALDFSYSADLSDFDRLQAAVHQGLDQTPDQVAGFLSRLHGYVAEQAAADVLRSQGHHVEFPGASNQPGYDLLVDGQPVQIKAGLDPQAIRDHLQAHPDIPVYTSPEMAATSTASIRSMPCLN